VPRQGVVAHVSWPGKHAEEKKGLATMASGSIVEMMEVIMVYTSMKLMM